MTLETSFLTEIMPSGELSRSDKDFCGGTLKLPENIEDLIENDSS